MQKRIKNPYDTWLGRNFIILGVLTMLWLALTLLYIITFDTSFSIWSYNHPKTDIKNLNYNLIYKGETFKGEFVAQDNNLGIVSIRFQTYTRPPYSLEDHYLFRIKEKGSQNWYYQNTYRSGLVYDVSFFPFGFPQIVNSKGKTYQFELTSLNGNSVNALAISNRSPILVSKYKYSGHELITNKIGLLKFFVTKVYNAMQTTDVWFSSLIYLLPLVFYVLSLFLKNKFFDLILSAIVLIDIFIIQLTNDTTYLVLIPLWIVVASNYKRANGCFFLLGILLLLISPFLLFLKEDPTAEKAVIWAYVFLVTGTIQILFELKE